MSRVPFSSDDAEDIGSLTGDRITVSDTKVRITVGTGDLEVLDGRIECKSEVRVAAGITFSDGTTQTSRGENPLRFSNTLPVVGGAISRAQGSNLVLYSPPDMTGFAPLASPTFTGTVSIGGGLISNSIVSVGTNWVDVPNTQPRGAYLILARSEDDTDSALVASVADDSDSTVGYINVMARKGDATTNYYLALQYPGSSNVQIKMSNGNTRNVSIMVIRA